MKHKIAVVLIIVSVFAIGLLVSQGYGIMHSQSIPDASDDTKDHTIAESSPAPAKEAATEPTNTPTPEPTATPTTEPTREPLDKYLDLLKVNPYISGWLSIDGTAINEPVVYTPGSQNYFLHRDLDGNDTSRGTLFIAVNWRDGFNNTLIYGHNMKDGTVFGSLAKFAQKSYGEKHPVIRFDTLYEEREYELLGVFYSQIDEDELETEEDRASKDKAIEEAAIAKKEEEAAEAEAEAEKEQEAEVTPEPTPEPEPVVLTLNDIDLHRDFGDEDIYRLEKDEDNGRFRYYYYTDLADKDDFDYYVKNVKERALYDTGVDAEWGDDLITLSTCSYHVKNGRFVVVAVRKK